MDTIILVNVGGTEQHLVRNPSAGGPGWYGGAPSVLEACGRDLEHSSLEPWGFESAQQSQQSIEDGQGMGRAAGDEQIHRHERAGAVVMLRVTNERATGN